MSMQSMEQLHDKLCKELDNIANRGELSASMLETTDKLSRTIKNLEKIMMHNEGEEYEASYRYGGRSYRDGGYRDSYDDGSYARGRDARRDNMGRYSRDGYSRHEGKSEMIEQLRDMMNSAPDEKTRQEFERMIRQMEQ